MKARNHGVAVSLRRWLGVLALACFSLSAVAGNRVSRSEFDAFRDLTTGATKSTVGFGSNGTPIITRGVPGSTNVGNMNFSHNDGFWPTVGADADLLSPIPGKTLPITGKAAMSKAAMAGAIGRFIGKVSFPLTVGMAAYDFAKEMGFDLNWDSASGTNIISQPNPDSGCAANCYKYWVGTVGPSNPVSYSENGACLTYQSYLNTPPNNYNFAGAYVAWWAAGGADYCYISSYNKTTGAFNAEAKYGFSKQSIAPWGTPSPYIRTGDDITAAAMGYNGLPLTSAIDRVLADAVNGGEALMTDEANGFAVSSSTTKVVSDPVTVTSSDGSTVTSQQACSWVADLVGTVTWSCYTTNTNYKPAGTATQTVVTTNPDGTTSTSTVTSNTPSSTTSTTSTASLTPNDPCPAGASRLGCSVTDVPYVEVPKGTKSVTYAPDDLGLGAGACPSPISMAVHGGTYTISYQAACDFATSILRPLLLAIAAMMAYFIVSGGIREG